MKKITALLLVCILLVSLAACQGTTPDETIPSTGTNPSESTGQTNPQSDPPTDPSDEPIIEPTVTSIADLLAMQLEEGEETTERYVICGTVETLSNPTYGEMTVSDGTGSIYVYGTYSSDGSLRYSEMTEKAFAGDRVTLSCTLKRYNGTIEVHNARLIGFETVPVEVDESKYTEMTIADARSAVSGTLIKTDGIVARITYASGMVPNGVVLVDETGSVYIYDSDLAARVTVGNQITVLGSKDYWILDSEQSNAEKFGYKGCNQLTSAILIENDGGSHDFDRSWIPESTVKEILDTPRSEDITTKIFKVTAQIREDPGSGFTNFYINDLDGTTGSYCYSQCNGSDFAWLREYDGKICTVYLMALNAKSTASDCFFRFLPVAVVDEGFDPSSINIAEHAVKYYGVVQFQSNYTGNPALPLLTSVSSDVLGFENAALTYASSDSSVISIDGGVLNCLKSGTAIVTVTGNYGNQTYCQDVTITIAMPETSVPSGTVADAIAASVGDTVTIKGIVGPSLVNKTGFYLIDATGVIAVQTDAGTLATLKIGYEVILEGVRHFNAKGEGSNLGQTCINDAKVIANNYGSHDYSTASFAGEISVVDFYNLDPTADITTCVYTMKATVEVEESAYYTNIFLSDGTTKIRLYCSSAKQYSWLMNYAGQEITVEIAPCNWNSKDYYTGCVLAVIHEDGSKTPNELNFQN
ncbi:MAG: hypothetical protein ACI4PO_01785 [Faecousia sp.]